jgi:hypothetical protein
MASETQTTRFKRKLRKANAGRRGKAARRNQGSTPSFPLHTPEADANAPAQVKPTDD